MPFPRPGAGGAAEERPDASRTRPDGRTHPPPRPPARRFCTVRTRVSINGVRRPQRAEDHRRHWSERRNRRRRRASAGTRRARRDRRGQVRGEDQGGRGGTRRALFRRRLRPPAPCARPRGTARRAPPEHRRTGQQRGGDPRGPPRHRGRFRGDLPGQLPRAVPADQPAAGPVARLRGPRRADVEQRRTAVRPRRPGRSEQRAELLPVRAYGNAKLELVLFTRELHDRYHERGLSAVAFHPGGVSSNFARTSRSSVGALFRTPVPRLFFQPPRKAAGHLLRFVTPAPGEALVSGAYYENGRPRTVKAPPVASRLWETTAALLGLDEG